MLLAPSTLLPPPTRQVVLAVTAATTLRQLADAAWPREAVALLGGQPGSATAMVQQCLPLPNTAIDADRFAIAPADFLAGLASLERGGLCLLGFAHSHPGGQPAPSAVDRQQLWPHCLQLILGGPRPGAWTMAAFWLGAGEPQRLVLQTTASPLQATGFRSPSTVATRPA